MKNPFKEYPSVFYQIIIIALLAQTSFFIYTFYSTSFNYLFDEGPIANNEYAYLLPLVSGVAYLIGGLITDRIASIKSGFYVGVIAFLIGTLLNYLEVLGLFTTNFFVHSGLAIVSILSIKHIGILFPIANDWKDNAFLILLISPLVTGILLGIFFEFYDFTIWFEDSTNIFVINLSVLLLMFLLIGKFNDIGYEIEEEEEENLEENQFIKLVMILLVILNALFVFKVQYLPSLYNPYASGDYITTDVIGINDYVETFLTGVVAFVFVIILLYRPTYRPTQFKKMNILCWLLLSLAIIELAASSMKSVSLDNMVNQGYNYIYSIFMIPIFLSIMTHVNLNKNLGWWIGLFYGASYIFPTLISLFVSEEINSYLPYIALLMLVLFMLSFRENRVVLEEKLALDKSSHGDEEDEDGIDILDHFVEE